MSVAAPTRTSSGERNARLVGWGLAAVGFGLAYAGTLKILIDVWRHNPNYSHGFLIPPVAAWLLWRDRAALREATSPGSWLGIVLLLAAVLVQFVGLRGDVATLQGLSLILALAGVILQLQGSRFFRRAAFAIAFLIFMIPTLPLFMNTLSFKLKVLAARGAIAVSHALGVMVQRDGVNLVFPGGVLSVENACSGLRSLVALMALGALFAYLAQGSIWKRIALFALALPIAVLANVLRISALCIYAGLGSVQGAAGLFHEVGGFALFGIAFLLLLLCRRILRC
jgi:exosortase A